MRKLEETLADLNGLDVMPDQEIVRTKVCDDVRELHRRVAQRSAVDDCSHCNNQGKPDFCKQCYWAADGTKSAFVLSDRIKTRIV